MEKRFIVKNVVSDYGVFDTQYGDGEYLECICSARANADLIADILNTDYSKPNECTYYENKLQQENKELKEQLAEKDKEIKRLKYLLLDKENKSTFFEQLYNQTIEDAKVVKDCGSFTALNKIIRKQVCDEIRTYDRTTNKQKVSYTEYVMGLCEFLDQIEQGEQQ